MYINFKKGRTETYNDTKNKGRKTCISEEMTSVIFLFSNNDSTTDKKVCISTYVYISLAHLDFVSVIYYRVNEGLQY